MHGLAEGSLEWDTDHKAIQAKILGLKVLRREAKMQWQRPTYKTKGMGETQTKKLTTKMGTWVQVGQTTDQKLENITRKIQKNMNEVVGRKKEWASKPCMQPKNEATTEGWRKVNEIRKLLNNKNKEGQDRWMEEEAKRCRTKKDKQESLTPAETKMLEKSTALSKEEVKWHMHKRWEAIKAEVRKEEEKILMKK